ncbi:protein fluG-like [Solanum verrucosum]|uniref:protein fluG-like n=1 Tax=Solanum verrucosum TaxID=315347 RepID=UPI0020D18D6F|nr:protein fluG-like [Solanum verrucosum]
MENFEELKRSVESVEMVDDHAHNIVALDSTLPFLSCFSQSVGGKTASDFPNSTDFKVNLNEICELYGSSLSLDAVEESRRCLGLEASAAVCFKAARIVILLIDDGIKLDKKLDIKWHERLVPTVGRILQVEHAAENILEKGSNGESWTLSSFMETFTKGTEVISFNVLVNICAKVVAFKSIIAHRCGLAINTKVTQREAEEGLNDILCAGKPVRISNKNFSDYIFMHALEVAQNFNLPMQIDTSLEEKDLDLRPGNPLNLRNLLEDKRFTKNRLVLLHASFPFLKEASYLASVYPQVYLDFGLRIPKPKFHGLVSSVKELLDLAPINKVMITCSGIAFAETFYLGAKKAREVVFNVLWDACVHDDLSITEAIAIVKAIFAENAKQFYKLDASSRYSDVEPQSLSYPFKREDLNCPLTDVTAVRIIWLDFSAQHRCRVAPQHRYYSCVKKHGVGLTVECMRLSSISDNLCEEHSLPSSGEVRVVPDLSTKCKIPWARNQEMVLADMLTESGKAWQYCPRDVLRKFSKILEDEFGLVTNVGIEVEFYLFKSVLKDGKETWARIDKTSYCSTTAIDVASLVLQEIVASLHSNILVEQLHSEAGKGQFEIVLGYTDGGRAANNLIITHEVIKGVARKHGLLASFTPRYNYDDVGSGSDVHISLFKNGENVFMASGEPNRYGMSVIGESFMAGVLDHLRSLCVFTMPISNSYERLIPKARNSSFICWGIECKELPVRACCPPGAPNGVVTNFEMKTFDGSANPHLGLASIIIAGIDGMRRKLPIPRPVEPESYDFDWNNDGIKVPGSLRCAIIHMDSDKWFNEMLGKEFICTRG